MNRCFIFKSLIALTAVFLAIGCDNELDINAPHKDITVVYSTLNENADTNWVRINRTYLGNDGAAGGNQQPDSIYYNNLQVILEELNAAGNVINTFALPRDEQSRNLDSGYFTTDGYHLFRIDQAINGTSTYRLTIDKPDGNLPQVSATTPIVGGLSITEPKAQLPVSFGRTGEEFAWKPANNARIYQGFIRLHYVETNNNNVADSVRKFVDYKFPIRYGDRLDGTGSDISVNISYETYYRFLLNSIGVNNNVRRFFRGIDMFVTAGADDLSTYISISQPAQGIVQDKPFYTNVTNGAGIFSSISKVEKLGMAFSIASRDSLVKGIYTCELRFAKAQAGDTCMCDRTSISGFRCE